MLIPKQTIPLSNMKSRPFLEQNWNQDQSLISITASPLKTLTKIIKHIKL